MTIKKCSGCVYSISIDHGYSNYTVEGTDIYCAKSLNPDMPFDRWYGEDKRDLFAETCKMYRCGSGISIDCETEDKVESNDLDVRWASYLNEYVTGADIDRIY